MKVVFLMLSSVTMFAFPGWSQTPQPAKTSFEVASIKPSDPNQPGGRMEMQPNGHFVARGITVRSLLRPAYRLQDFQIAGGPGWIDTDRWDIEARAPEGSIPRITGFPDPNVPGPLEMLVQSLLEDRFGLKVHRETREFPVYDLTTAKSGAKMKLSADQTFRLPQPDDPRPPAGSLPRGAMRAGSGHLEANAIPFSNFVAVLSGIMSRTIIDKAGLTGFYDIKLQWTPDQPVSVKPGGNIVPGTEPVIDPSGPTIFTALQEQLGLKLESAKGPVEVLVIDRVEKPSEN